ncbi:uncharacterized protein LOC136078457 [Hydra vulgaris]|uniref:Uncharacterized protein LOC136078457 n=1 Tax=Hydra vulgaris TaxID=6087 RepID=A0ABM4BMJ1_HYDVU
MSTKVDLKLILEFSGNDQQSVAEWLEKVEVVCKLIGVTDLASVVSLCLTIGAFVFVTRKLKHGEAVNVYLAELQRLSTLIRGLPDREIVCGYVCGLPEKVRRMLRSRSCLYDLTTIQILARARALMIEKRNKGKNENSDAAAATKRCAEPKPLEDQMQPICYECKLPNHFARDCHLRRSSNRNKSSGRREPRNVLCYSCQEIGHISRMCQWRRCLRQFSP